MSKATLRSLIACAIAGTSLSSPVLADPTAVEQVRQMEQRFYQAFLDADGEAMAAIFADDFAYQHGSGATYNEDDFVELVASRAVTVTRADTPTMEFRDFDDVIVTYGNGPVGGMVGSDPYLVDLRFVNIWHRTGNTWELTHRNSELLPLEE